MFLGLRVFTLLGVWLMLAMVGLVGQSALAQGGICAQQRSGWVGPFYFGRDDERVYKLREAQYCRFYRVIGDQNDLEQWLASIYRFDAQFTRVTMSMPDSYLGYRYIAMAEFYLSGRTAYLGTHYNVPSLDETQYQGACLDCKFVRMHGPAVWFHENGRVKEVATYVMRGSFGIMLHGNNIRYHSNGRVSYQGLYERGALIGEAKEYNPNGSPKR